METVMAVYAWVADNIEGILAAIAAVHVAAVAIVNLTPTPKDDAIVERVYSVIEKVAGLFSPKAKQ